MPKSPNAYFVGSAIPYVNAKPHLGHVLEWFQADTIARFQRLQGKDVAFVCGADENSLKNVQAAEKVGVEPQAWLDQYAKIFEEAFKTLNISLTSFRRGSDQKNHWPGVQKLWQLCDQAGDIYKKTYTGLYCVGCEMFYTEEELIDGKCPEHLTVPEKVEEENYFFRLSKYEKQIRELIQSDELKVVSDQYKNEMLGFMEKGLEDFSVSRSATRSRGVGVPVPGDDSQVMYVWFDALAIYITGIGWDYDHALFEKYWPADVHFVGKGINRFHSIYWIGMLLSAGLAIPKAVSVHGYLTVNGQKMSKSLGNVIDPFELVKKYGLEPVRWYLLKEITTHGDGDFSNEKFREIYTADLANGLGNLCSRVAKLCEKSGVKIVAKNPEIDPEFIKLLNNFDIDLAAKWVAAQITLADQYLNQQKPWAQNETEQATTLREAVQHIRRIALHLQPFLPEVATKISEHFSQEKITALEPLFPRLDTIS